MNTRGKDWNAALYLKFEDERTRPSIDLLARVTVVDPARCIDLGCGPGNSTELVAARFPQAAVEGLDSSNDMLDKARRRLPALGFVQADLAEWRPPAEGYDLIFANAVLQWLTDQEALMGRLAQGLAPGGCLAVQMPNNTDEPAHRAMREVAAAGPWAARLSRASQSKAVLGAFEDYRRWLQEAGCAVDLWQTTYVHALKGVDAIVEWFSSTGLKPFIDPLAPDERADYLARYRALIAEAYPEQPDGMVLLRFPRLFIVATKLAR